MNGHRPTSSSLWFLLMMILFIGALSFSFAGCIKKEPIRVGFVAELSGKQAELGVQERNAVQLAVDAVNASGGVVGRQIELIIRDDLGTPDGAKIADHELINAGVVAIIGHATSKETEAALPVIDAAHMVMISPTTSAPQLSGVSKYFFRVFMTSLPRTQYFAQHIFKSRGLSRIAIIYDTDNAAYTKSFAVAFSNKFQSLGGKVVAEQGYSSSAKPDFSLLMSKLRATGAEGLVIIASDFDTAIIAQRTRLIGWRVPLFTSGWAQTDILVNNGGRAVEGLEIEQSYAIDPQSPNYLDFKKRFETRFGRAPSFGAAFGYETVMVLAAALKKTGGKAEGLREALLEIHDFQGLVDTFSFDKNGDVLRPFYLGAIRDGKFVTSKTYTP
ncbi:MAG TPA: ABC transporter substrate-binding protein [Syntrophales bacterium]|nr:ABC transporter substrate-binding protein [Syntrophales bacterium]